jgi:hypothetical protein
MKHLEYFADLCAHHSNLDLGGLSERREVLHYCALSIFWMILKLSMSKELNEQ